MPIRGTQPDLYAIKTGYWPVDRPLAHEVVKGGLAGPFLPLAGGTMTGDIIPDSTDLRTLGGQTLLWSVVFADQVRCKELQHATVGNIDILSSLVPIGAGRDLGDAGNQFDDLFLLGTGHIDAIDGDGSPIRFIDNIVPQTGLTGETCGESGRRWKTGYFRDIDISVQALPDADDGANIGSATLRFTGIHAKILRVHNFSIDPVVNGEFTLNGSDVKVFSGGAVRNLSNSAPAQATQAAIEAETNEDTYVPPDRIKNSPGVSKAYCEIGEDGTLQSGSYNITSTAKDSTGVYTITLATDFSGTGYTVVGTPEISGQVNIQTNSKAAGTFKTNTRADSGGATIDKDHQIVAFGDQ